MLFVAVCALQVLRIYTDITADHQDLAFLNNDCTEDVNAPAF